MDLQNKIKNKRESATLSFDLFKNEDGAIDLASIMVGIIVIGLIGGVIASTVFVVIPWSQDNAAKQQLDSIVQAENAYFGLSSATPSPLPAGSPSNSFADSAGLMSANLLQSSSSYCVATSNSGKNYQGYSVSASGSVWSVTDQNSKPFAFTGALPANCQFILTSTGSNPTPSPSPTSNDLTWSQQTSSTVPGPLFFSSGNFNTQLAKVSSSTPYISTNSGALWSSTPTVLLGDAGAVSENGTNLLVGKTLAANGFSGYVYFSNNGGASWSQLTTLGGAYVANAWLSNDGTKIIIAGGGGGGNTSLKISTDGGSTFKVLKYIGSSYLWLGLAVSSDGSRIYALDNTGTLSISSDSGTTWTTKTVVGSTGISIDSTGKRVLMNTGANGKVLVSNDYGASFTPVAVGTSTTQKRTVNQQAVSSDGQTMTVTGVEGSGTKVFISRDGGQTWTAQSTLQNLAWVSKVSSDGTQFLISSGTTVYKG